MKRYQQTRGLDFNMFVVFVQPTVTCPSPKIIQGIIPHLKKLVVSIDLY